MRFSITVARCLCVILLLRSRSEVVVYQTITCTIACEI